MAIPAVGRQEVAANYLAVQERMAAAATRSGRDPGAVQLVAVTKTVPLESVELVLEAGVTVLGENRVQEAHEKIPPLRERFPEARWHLIGHLQTNKARAAVDLFDTIESIDSLRLAQIIERRAGEAGRILPVLLEVNAGGESSKHGFRVEEVQPAMDAIGQFPHLRIDGLMTIAPMASNPEDVRPVFRTLRELRDDLVARYTLGTWCDRPLPILSMGMTADFEVAIEEGATLIRLGRALFGPRR